MGTGFSKKKKEARLLQDQFSKMQGQLESLEIVGSTANDLVVITLSGEGDLKKIKIKPECVDPEDVEGLEMLIKSAHQDAQKKLKEQSSKSLPNIPGLGNFF